MDIFLATLAFLCSIIGLIGCIVPVLPGIVLNYAALLLLTLTDYADISLSTLFIWGVVTAVVTVADFYLPAWMTRRFGGMPKKLFMDVHRWRLKLRTILKLLHLSMPMGM